MNGSPPMDSDLNSCHLQSEDIIQDVPMQPTAAIYFCFVDDKYDKPSDPNKLILARGSPTVSDLCSTLKVLFFPGHEVTLSATFVQGNQCVPSEYPENSPIPVPVNDRSNVVLLKTRYVENPPKLNAQTIQILQWLQANNLESHEIVNAFLQNRIVLDNMKNLKDADLINFGIKDWGTRIAILEAINKYFTLLPSFLDPVHGGMTRSSAFPSSVNPAIVPAIPMENHFNQLQNPVFISNKRSKTPTSKKKIRFKDLDVLVNDPLIPVDIGA
eukprot:TRINITY_DN4586_c0_g1_i1.p1 TRINITY_DN4586_c0_g1~~TRINITY_DN4586_c0_g1_i1.p1  ORF type:complete len:281 (-),score=64.63 TRINITY_DN4586_c0_g1_i1:565-1377(-)